MPPRRAVLAGIDLPSFVPRLSRALDERVSLPAGLVMEVPFLRFDCLRL
jgi:hypothetical protein